MRERKRDEPLPEELRDESEPDQGGKTARRIRQESLGQRDRQQRDRRHERAPEHETAGAAVGAQARNRQQVHAVEERGCDTERIPRERTVPPALELRRDHQHDAGERECDAGERTA